MSRSDRVPIVLSASPLDEAPPARIVFSSLFGLVDVELEPSASLELHWTVGSEGLGSEFFLDEQKRLRSFSLELLPRRVVEVRDAAEMQQLQDRVAAGAVAASVKFETVPVYPINPTAIFVSEPGGVMVVFDPAGAEIAPGVRRRIAWEGMTFYRVGVGVLLAVRTGSGELSAAWFDDPWKEQRIAEERFVQHEHPRACSALQAIHMAYFRECEPSAFAASAKAALSGAELSPSQRSAIDRIVDFYGNHLRLMQLGHP